MANRRILNQQADRIEAVLAQHKVQARVSGGTVTPNLVRFNLTLAPHIKLSKLNGLAEELALEERIADRAAVDDDEGAAGALALSPDGAREDVLARAGLPLEQHRRVGARDALEDREDGAHGEALADGGAERRAILAGVEDDVDEVGQVEVDLARLVRGADQIGERVGKSKASVYARMKLVAPCPDARKLVEAGKLTKSKGPATFSGAGSFVRRQYIRGRRTVSDLASARRGRAG